MRRTSHAPLADEVQTISQSAPPRRSLKKLALLSLFMFLPIIAVTFAISHYRARSSDPIPASIRSKVDFSVYYPYGMPSGLQVAQSSFSGTKQVITYIIQEDGKNKYYVSVQPLPSDFDFPAFKNKFFETDEFVTGVGDCFVGDVGSGLIGSIRTKDNAWILISTGDYSTSAYNQLETLERTFQKVN